jgi:hypothetical protein
MMKDGRRRLTVVIWVAPGGAVGGKRFLHLATE